jgi:hypothetical protein
MSLDVDDPDIVRAIESVGNFFQKVLAGEMMGVQESH